MEKKNIISLKIGIIFLLSSISFTAIKPYETIINEKIGYINLIATEIAVIVLIPILLYILKKQNKYLVTYICISLLPVYPLLCAINYNFINNDIFLIIITLVRGFIGYLLYDIIIYHIIRIFQNESILIINNVCLIIYI